MKMLVLLALFFTFFGAPDPLNAEAANVASGVKGDFPATPANMRALMKSAAAGEPGAQYDLACIYLFNPYFINGKDAWFWMHNSADMGYAKAQFLLAYMLARGIGCEKNVQSSRDWLQLSAKNGNENARKVLAGESFELAISKMPRKWQN